jgi:hypothetical protein
MPDENFDYSRFASGGCIVTEDQPDIRCKECGFETQRFVLESLRDSSNQ